MYLIGFMKLCALLFGLFLVFLFFYFEYLYLQSWMSPNCGLFEMAAAISLFFGLCFIMVGLKRENEED